MEGIRVVEVASWTFVPAAGAVLAEWGADVLKIEHPESGDPQRGLISSGMIPGGADGVNYMMEQPNHGKRSVALNLSHPDGKALLYKLCETADVFLTNWLPGPRQRQQIDVDDIRKVNPNIIYVRGHGQGTRGPDADKGGYDGSSYYARSGVLAGISGGGGSGPYGPTQPPAFGDLPGGQTIAGAVATALLHKERTGEGSIVDISLLNFGMWCMAAGIVSSKLYEGVELPKFTRETLPNPLTNRYLTSDGRMIQLMMLQANRFWPEVVAAIGHPELADDPRFNTPQAMNQNAPEATKLLDEIFATRTFVEWKQALHDIKGQWAPVQTPIELHDDADAIANGYLADVTSSNGVNFKLVANPVQFNNEPNTLTRAPDHGEHTDEVLQELGLDWDELIRLKTDNAIL
ncbi:MAG TPA: CoA transferase [Acidimicrobiia bacterium]|jgi:crotonobetainyl-CoA:carnitine CoA-transferase CaiB-like acyl-CoA transferase